MLSITSRLLVSAMLGIVIAGCASTATSRPPLSDHIILIPVSDKADVESGLRMDYFHGSNQQALNHVSCKANQSCFFSGLAFTGVSNKALPQWDSLVIRTYKNDRIDWARTYQLRSLFYHSSGMLATPDGGAVLYGSTFKTSDPGGNLHILIEPTFEKIDAQGIPQWGAMVNFGSTMTSRSFTDAVQLNDGGFVLSGSISVKNKWRGLLIRLDKAGHQVWATTVSSYGQFTLMPYVTRIANGDLVGAGYNRDLRDLVLFEFSPDGKLIKAPIIDMRGVEFPESIISLGSGPVLVAAEKMPSGEQAALVLRMNNELDVTSASRYRYKDGFIPYSAIAMGTNVLCLYGPTAADEHKQSIAFTINRSKQPVSAIALDGDGVFNFGTLLTPKKIIFSGGRDLGTKQRASSIAVTWTPSVMNQANVLKNIRREPVTITEHTDESATQWISRKSILQQFGPKEMSSRLVSGNTPPAASGSISGPQAKTQQ